MTVSSPRHAETKPPVSPAMETITSVERRVLARVYQHPLSHNFSWREALSLIQAIGNVDHAHNGEVILSVGGERQVFIPSHHKDLTADDVMSFRHFLTRAGWEPGEPPRDTATLRMDGKVIVIDHRDARLYAAGAHGLAPEELHHLQHFVDRTEHDADREETYPDDASYFRAIAAAAEGDGEIVIVDHGTGQSNEASHLMAYLCDHSPAVHNRVARVIVADLPHTSVPELLEMARVSLGADAEDEGGPSL